MAYDFPNTPAIGDIAQSPSTAYRWDGVKWTNNNVGGSIWLPLAGGTMTGPLTLSRDPLGFLEAATKQYVDDNTITPTAGDLRWVNVAGDTMTGVLTTPQVITSAASYPRYTWHSSGAPVDQKQVDAYVDPTGNFTMQFVNDAFNTGAGFLSVTRSGITPQVMTLTSGIIDINSQGLVYSGLGGTHKMGFLWDGSWVQAFIDGTYVYQLASIPWVQSNYKLASAYTPNQGVDVASQPTFNGMITSSVYGINYAGIGGYWIGFGWNGYLNLYVSGGYQGDLWMVGQLDGRYKAIGAYTPNQNVDSGASPQFGNLTVTGWLMNWSGTFYVANNTNYYLARNGSDGYWRFVENGTINCTIDTGGTITARGNVVATNVLYAAGNQIILANGGSGRYLQFSGGGWYLDWNSSNGTLQWMLGGGGPYWVMRNDQYCYNAIGPVGGTSAYFIVSDERTKADIKPATMGLAEVLKLNPIRFRRITAFKERASHIEDAEEIGFSAQQLREVIPEAVFEFGLDLADGTGGVGSDNPTLARTDTPIIAALVNAVKELAAEVALLKQQRTLH